MMSKRLTLIVFVCLVGLFSCSDIEEQSKQIEMVAVKAPSLSHGVLITAIRYSDGELDIIGNKDAGGKLEQPIYISKIGQTFDMSSVDAPVKIANLNIDTLPEFFEITWQYIDIRDCQQKRDLTLKDCVWEVVGDETYQDTLPIRKHTANLYKTLKKTFPDERQIRSSVFVELTFHSDHIRISYEPLRITVN